MKIIKNKEYLTKKTNGGYNKVKVLAFKGNKIKIKENISATNLPYWITYWVSRETFLKYCKPL